MTGNQNPVFGCFKMGAMFVGAIVGGLILFALFRYVLNPVITASVTAATTEGCIYGVSVGDSPVLRVRFSPDGKVLAVVGQKREALVEADDGSFISGFASGSDRTSNFVISPDSRHIAFRNKDAIKIVSIDGDAVAEFAMPGGQLSFVSHVNGVAAPSDEGVHFYKLDGTRVTLLPTKNPIDHLAVSPDSQTIAAAEENGLIWLWPITELGIDNRIQAHEGKVTQMMFSSDSQRLVTIGDDEQANVWNIVSRELIQTLESIGKPSDASIDSEATYLAISDSDGLVTIWNLATGDVEREWEFGRAVRSISLSPDATKLAVGLAKVVTMVDRKLYRNRQRYRNKPYKNIRIKGESHSPGTALVLETELGTTTTNED